MAFKDYCKQGIEITILVNWLVRTNKNHLCTILPITFHYNSRLRNFTGMAPPIC